MGKLSSSNQRSNHDTTNGESATNQPHIDRESAE